MDMFFFTISAQAQDLTYVYHEIMAYPWLYPIVYKPTSESMVCVQYPYSIVYNIHTDMIYHHLINTGPTAARHCHTQIKTFQDEIRWFICRLTVSYSEPWLCKVSACINTSATSIQEWLCGGATPNSSVKY